MSSYLLVGVQKNKEVIAAYASAWESGAIDAAVANGSMAYEVSLHHIAGFLFGKDSALEDCVQSKVAAIIVESSMRKPEQVWNISMPSLMLPCNDFSASAHGDCIATSVK